MINEPRTYRHSPIQLGFVILVFGVFGVGLLTIVNSTDYLFLIPLAVFFGIIFITMLYSMTTKTTISDNEISTQTVLGTKSLTWSEINRVSGRGNAIKLHNSDGDVTVAPNQQLPGYEEIVEWVGIKRPDLFTPQEYSEMTKSWINGILLPFLGLIVIGFGAFLIFQLNTTDSFFPILIFFMIGIVILVTSFSAPQSLTIDGKSLLVKYLFNQKTILADEIKFVELKHQSTRNGKVYFIMLNLISKKTVRISGLNPSLPIVYLTLKNWHRKNIASDNSTGRL